MAVKLHTVTERVARFHVKCALAIRGSGDIVAACSKWIL